MDKVKYFYTTDTPYAWSSGPNIFYFDENMEYISSLDKAKELALEHRSGKPGEEKYIETNYGFMVETEPK